MFINKLRLELVICILFYVLSFFVLCVCTTHIVEDAQVTSVPMLMSIFIVSSLSITATCLCACSLCLKPILQDIRVLKDKSVRLDKNVCIKKTSRRKDIYMYVFLFVYILLVRGIEPLLPFADKV